METQTIRDLRSLVLEAEKTLKLFRPNDYEGQAFGQEGEYLPDMLKTEMRALLTDIRGLVRAPKRFVRISTYQERQNILGLLQNIQACMASGDFHSTANSMDQLKSMIRTYHVRGSSESKDELVERMNELNAMFSDLEVKTIQAGDTLSKVQNFQEQYDQLFNMMNDLNEKIPQIESLHQQSNSQLQGIQESFTSAKAQEETIATFSRQIEMRDSQLAKQQQSTEEYEELLKGYAIEQSTAKEQIKNLIDNAKLALQYTTAAGFSAAFTDRYNANRKWWKVCLNFVWVLAAGASIGGALCVIYTLLSGKILEVGDYIARILIMPPAIWAAWFCATRYVRYNNITEDYGYKSVLAKSMVAFLDQFQGEERTLYLKTVLRQLLQDPLRKQHDMEHPASSILQRFKRSKKDDGGDK